VHPGWRHAAALTLGVAAATTGGSDVVRAAFRLIRGDTAVRRDRRPDLATEPAEPARGGAPNKPDEPREANTARLVEVDEPSLETALRGGAWIGYLERAAISATLLAGWPEGIALVLALKGVGRYPELKEPSPSSTNAPEAFIIGTLVSVLWAAGAAGTASLLV
jgi:hypothetical protein